MKKIVISILLLCLLAFLPHIIYSYRDYNVLLITIDTLRSDFLSCYNPKASPTPNIDRLAKQAVLFRKAFTLIPITLPAHASMLTSHPPHETNLFDNGQVFLHKTPLLSEILSKKNFKTAAFVSMGVLKSNFGLKHGFDVYEERFRDMDRWYCVASEMNAQAIPWIEKRRNERFFAWIHYSDPHEPYIPADAPPDTEVLVNGKPAGRVCMAKKERNHIEFEALPGENTIEFHALNSEAEWRTFVDRLSVDSCTAVDLMFDEHWKSRTRGAGAAGRFYSGGYASIKVICKNQNPGRLSLSFEGGIQQGFPTICKNYQTEVLYIDQYIGKLRDRLEQLGLQDRTIVILTADHGESLGEHDRIGHLFPLTPEITQVPMMIYYPHLGRSGESDRLVNHLDIAPTILDLLHIKMDTQMHGQSLKRLVSWSPVDWLFASRFNRQRSFLYTFAPGGRVNSYAVIEGDVKMIQTRRGEEWEWEAYDLEKDSTEMTNLFLFDPARTSSQPFSSLRPALEAYSKEAQDAHSKRKNPELNEEAKGMLRDLGYVTP